jgi:CrcB protein
MIAILVALAGAAGAAARFVVDGTVRNRWSTAFPWATMLVNVTGSLALGLLAGAVLNQGTDAELQVVLGTGFCGGYTTFSTASFETFRLLQGQRYTLAALNGVGSLALTVGAAALGLLVTR